MGKTQPSPPVLFSRLRQDVLAAFLLHPQREWYLNQLVRHLGRAPGHLHRELTFLVRAGLLRRRVEGRQVYYSPDPGCPYLPELSGLIRKTAGIPQVLAEALSGLQGRIACAFIFGSVARGEEQPGSDIDLWVVGDITTSDLLPALTQAEKATGRPVNPTIYPPAELAEKCGLGHHFVRAVVADPAKIFVIGGIDELARAARRQPLEAAPNEPG